MRESLVIILTVYVSLVLCQDLNNRQNNIDEFIQQLGPQNGNENTTLKPIRNPFQNTDNQFPNGQNQGPTPAFGQQPQPENTGQSSLAYPSSVGQSSNRPTHNTNVSAFM